MLENGNRRRYDRAFKVEAVRLVTEERRRVHQVTCSMSRKVDPWDNAPMESFFGTLKTELIYREKFSTREDAKAKIFEYIEVFYNRERRHSSPGFKSPLDFERAATLT